MPTQNLEGVRRNPVRELTGRIWSSVAVGHLLGGVGCAGAVALRSEQNGPSLWGYDFSFDLSFSKSELLPRLVELAP